MIVDPNKEIPEEIRVLDKIKKNQKRRYELRYAIENEYHERDIEIQERQHERNLNKIDDKNYLD